MRFDNTFFSSTNAYLSKEPRYVVSIDFDGSVQYFTSHDDIANVPGTPIEGVLQGISATSQTLNPDRANATIGSMSFDLVDLAEAFTDHVRTELADNDVGLRGRTCKFYMGYATDQEGAGIIDGGSTDDDPDFDNFALFQTQIVRGVETKDGRYSVKCADIQRETKRQIFELALTYLTDSISDTATTIPVLDLSGFEGNVHGTGYTDAPSSEVIYIKLDKTKEIVRCPVSGISGNSFTNCVRGRFSTTPQAIEVDQTQDSDRRPKVAEYVYLELPAVKMAKAILTGEIHGTSDVLPSGWHAGVPTEFVRDSDFTGIGTDLWDTTDDTVGIVLRFDGIGKQDAKRFLETEIYLLLGLFSPVYADGQLGLKRMVPSLSDSPYSFEVNDTNIVSTTNLAHDMDSVQNNIRVDWNWNGDRFIRSTIIADSGSIARHGEALEKRLSFRGLVGTLFTEQVLRQLLTSLRDMYTGPPLRLGANGFHLLNQIEVGDACRVDLSHLRDYSQSGSNLVRTMAVHGMTVDWFKGVKLKLFGSSERADEIPPVAASEVLPDAFYSSEGDSLSTIGGLMSGNSTNSGSFTLTGSADMNADASIFYWDNDLTISSDTTINIEGNVQLRVKGFLTINGDFDGVGEGIGPGANAYSAGQHYYWSDGATYGNPGFIGNSKAHKGLLFRYPDDGGIPDWVWVTDRSPVTEGRYQAFPNLVLVVEGEGNGSITGIPTDMRGGGGAYGSTAGEKTGLTGRSYQRASGGAGGSGGAALCVVCRGGDFGVSGQITLDGGDGVEPTTFYAEQGGDYDIYGGCGGAGAPGALLWLLDGSSQTFPDLAGHFQAKTGEAPAQYALPLIGHFGNQSLSENDRPRKNMAPFYPDDITDYEQSGVNFRIIYLPDDITPTDDQPDILTPPTNVALTTAPDGVIINWDDPANDFDHIEIWAADEDVRGSAVLVGTSPSSTFKELLLELSARRFYWLRAIAADGTASVYEPDSSTTTLIAYPDPGAGNLLNDPDFDLSTAIPLFDISTADPDMHNTPWVGEVIDNALPSTTRDSSLNFVSGGGVSGSNAIKLIKGDPGTSPFRSTIQIISTRRIRSNSHRFRIQIRYRNNGASAFGNTTPGDDLSLYMRGMTEAVGGSQPGYGQPPDNGNLSFPVTGTDWEIATFVTESGVSPEDARYWFVDLISIDNQGTLAELEIDSIFVFPIAQVYVGATSTVAGKPGLVPQAAAGDEGLYLRGDATYGTPTGSGVDSFEGRTGVVVAVSGDYSGFYSALGHSHVIADISDFTDNSANWNTAYGWSDHALAGYFPKGADIPGSADLDTYTSNGLYHQNLNSSASSGTNYPGTGDFAGMLRVYADGLMIYQSYEQYNAVNIWRRNYYNGTWTAWKRSYNELDTFAPIASPTFTGTVTLPATNVGGTFNLFDNILRRAYMDDFAIRWQGVSGVTSTTIDYVDGQAVTLTMTADITTLTINNWPATSRLGQLELEIVQDDPARTIAWPAAVTWLAGVAPDLSTAGKTYSVHLTTRDGGTNIIGSYAADSAGVGSHTHAASDITAGTFTGAMSVASNWNWQDNRIIRPYIEDFAVLHQTVVGVASTTVNYSLGQSVALQLGANNITTLTISNWPATGRKGVLELTVTQGATPRTITWPAAVNWPGGTAPDLNVVNGRFLIYLTSFDAGTIIDGTFTDALS